MFKFIKRHLEKKELKKELEKALKEDKLAINFLLALTYKNVEEELKKYIGAEDETFSKAYNKAFEFALDWMDETIEKVSSIEKKLASL